MQSLSRIFLAVSLSVICMGAANADEVIFQDNFERAEKDDSREDVGNNWGTNSKSRAQGNKQVDLLDGTMHIVRHEVADHGVSVVQDLAFDDVVITMRFKIPKNGDLGINIADMKEKSVHAGHICATKITPWNVEVTDLKTGRMHLPIRTANKAGKLTAEQKEWLKTKTNKVKNKLEPGQWHDLKVTITGDTMETSIDGEAVASFSSEGIDHATKSRIRLAVNREATVDDIKVVRIGS
ncbi:MAG: family 16 glycoside hydrolase [Planctomycetota bacterium]